MSTPELSTHYHHEDIEQQPIIIMMRNSTTEQFSGYLRCSSIKYELRDGKKAGTNDKIKCKQYDDWFNEFTRKDGITLLGQFIPRLPISHALSAENNGLHISLDEFLDRIGKERQITNVVERLVEQDTQPIISHP